MAPQIPIDPPRKYEVNGEACKVYCLTQVVGVANDTVLLNASILPSTSHKFRVMGMFIQSAAAALAYVLFEDGTAADLFQALIPPNTNADALYLPIVDSGYFETSVNTSLTVDVATNNIYLNLFYIMYKP